MTLAPRVEGWLNFFFSNLGIGLTAYQVALGSGATNRQALLSAAVAFCGAAQAHFRFSPLETDAERAAVPLPPVPVAPPAPVPAPQPPPAPAPAPVPPPQPVVAVQSTPPTPPKSLEDTF